MLARMGAGSPSTTCWGGYGRKPLWEFPQPVVGGGPAPATTGMRAKPSPSCCFCPGIPLQRRAVQFFRPFHLDQHGKPLLLGVAILLRLNQPAPHLLIHRSGLDDLRGAVEPRDAALRQHAVGTQLRMAEDIVTLLPSARLSVVEPLPRSQVARWSSSNTMVLPRGVTWAKPFGNTVAIMQTLSGNAVLIAACSFFGMVGRRVPAGSVHVAWYGPGSSALWTRLGQPRSFRALSTPLRVPNRCRQRRVSGASAGSSRNTARFAAHARWRTWRRHTPRGSCRAPARRARRAAARPGARRRSALAGRAGGHGGAPAASI